MATDVIMPSLGFDMTEGRLARWLKNEGDPVEKGQAIAEIETEKATVEIEAAVSGILARTIVQAGETVPVGTVIGVIVETGEEVVSVPATPAPPPPAPVPEVGEGAAPSEARVKASPVARRMAEEAGLDLSRIKGSRPRWPCVGTRRSGGDRGQVCAGASRRPGGTLLPASPCP